MKHNIAFLYDSVFVASTVGCFIDHFMVTVERLLLRTATTPALSMPFQFSQCLLRSKVKV